MKVKNLDISEKDDKIVVFVEAEERSDKHGIFKARLRTPDILEILKKKNISHGNCLQEADVQNWHSHLKTGTWIFEKKTVDKPKKQVILKEEKPKTTRKRRTKKASTEE